MKKIIPLIGFALIAFVSTNYLNSTVVLQNGDIHLQMLDQAKACSEQSAGTTGECFEEWECESNGDGCFNCAFYFECVTGSTHYCTPGELDGGLDLYCP